MLERKIFKDIKEAKEGEQYMYIALFEDADYDLLYPLTYMRPAYALRIGVYTLIDRATKTSDKVFLYMRDYLTKYFEWRMKHEGCSNVYINKEVDDETLFINGKVVFDEKFEELLSKLKEKKGDYIVLKEGDIVAIKASSNLAKEISQYFMKPVSSEVYEAIKEKVEKIEIPDITLARFPWDIIKVNSEMVAKDLKEFVGKEWESGVDVTIIGDKKNAYIGKNVEIEPYVVIEARTGPVYIGDNTKVQAGARIEGPTYIGKDTIIVGGAQIREGSNIGDVCRVGGEFEESVMHGFSNKYHAGFIGHAYVCEWVNIGAMTTNSDLKNTYGTVRLTIRGQKIDTGMKKVGCFIGDMAKTAIGAYIYTGKRIGLASQVHGYITSDVPSFTFYAKSLGGVLVELYVDSVIETQRRMKARRKQPLPPEEAELIRKLFEITAPEREKAGVKKGKISL